MKNNLFSLPCFCVYYFYLLSLIFPLVHCNWDYVHFGRPVSVFMLGEWKHGYFNKTRLWNLMNCCFSHLKHTLNGLNLCPQMGFTVFMNIAGAIFSITSIVLCVIDLGDAALLWMCERLPYDAQHHEDNCRNVALFDQVSSKDSTLH